MIETVYKFWNSHVDDLPRGRTWNWAGPVAGLRAGRPRIGNETWRPRITLSGRVKTTCSSARWTKIWIVATQMTPIKTWSFLFMISYTIKSRKLNNDIIIHYFSIKSVIIEKLLNRIRRLIESNSSVPTLHCTIGQWKDGSEPKIDTVQVLSICSK